MSSPSTAIKQVVAGGFRHSGSLARAGWVVVARHRRPYFPDGPIPWGTVHVKRIGESWTACGIPTLGWHAFWHVHFPHDVDSRCVECGKALRKPLPMGR